MAIWKSWSITIKRIQTRSWLTSVSKFFRDQNFRDQHFRNFAEYRKDEKKKSFSIMKKSFEFAGEFWHIRKPNALKRLPNMPKIRLWPNFNRYQYSDDEEHLHRWVFLFAREKNDCEKKHAKKRKNFSGNIII